MSRMDSDGYILERRSLNRDLYYLLCIFSASKRIAEITTDYEYDMAWNLKLAYQTHEIQRLLLTIAIHFRVLYEQTEPLSEDDEDYEFFGDHDWRDDLELVGTFWNDLPKDDSFGLDFREACNKIIHAKEIQLHEEHLPEETTSKYLIPKISLYGNHHKKSWKVDIEIEKFISQAYTFTSMDPYEGI